ELASIEGCLVQEADQFQLKNTSGEDAPRGRSWKSGFLHKSAKSVDVLDQTHRLNLARHVGERVTITGILDDRELQGTSLKRIAESCLSRPVRLPSTLGRHPSRHGRDGWRGRRRRSGSCVAARLVTIFHPSEARK